MGSQGLRYAMTTSATDPDGKGLRDQLQLTIRTIDVTTPATPCDDFDGTLLYGPAGALSAGAIGSNAQGAQAGDRVRAAGLAPLRFHDLRHTSASLLLSAGVHPKVVSERLGHAGVSITLDTYSHVLPGLQEEAANLLDVYLRKPSRQVG